MVPAAGRGSARSGSHEARPAERPEPVRLAELLRKPTAPGEVRKDADEDRKAALRDALAATLGSLKAAPASPRAEAPVAASPAPLPPAPLRNSETRPAPLPVAAPQPVAAPRADALAAAVAPLAALPSAPIRPRPRGIPDDELRAILDAEE